MVVWQLSCRGSYHFLKCDCVADAVPLYQYTHWNWYSFRRPRKDDRLSQPPGVLIQRLTGLELRTLGSQAATRTTEPTPGSIFSHQAQKHLFLITTPSAIHLTSKLCVICKFGKLTLYPMIQIVDVNNE